MKELDNHFPQLAQPTHPHEQITIFSDSTMMILIHPSFMKSYAFKESGAYFRSLNKVFPPATEQSLQKTIGIFHILIALISGRCKVRSQGIDTVF